MHPDKIFIIINDKRVSLANYATHEHPARSREASTFYEACEIAAMIIGIGFFSALCVGLGLFAGAAMGGR